MEIEAIFFDVGNVLVEVCYEPLVAALEADFGIKPETVARLTDENDLILRYGLGRIDSARFFAEARETIGFPGSLSEMESLWCGIFRPLEANMALVKRLAPRLPLALISNTNASHTVFLESRFDVFTLFRHKIYSHLEGLIKPDRRIFELALQRMKVRAENALFIDDEADNVKAAETLGFNTLHLKEPSSLPAQLVRLFDLPKA